jgi:hypothetical protein
MSLENSQREVYMSQEHLEDAINWKLNQLKLDGNADRRGMSLHAHDISEGREVYRINYTLGKEVDEDKNKATQKS